MFGASLTTYVRQRNFAIFAAIASLLISMSLTFPRALRFRRELLSANEQLIEKQAELQKTQQRLGETQAEITKTERAIGRLLEKK